MVKVNIIHGFTDTKTGKNYQDNEKDVEISEELFDKLNGSFVEPSSTPVESKPKDKKTKGDKNAKVQE